MEFQILDCTWRKPFHVSQQRELEFSLSYFKAIHITFNLPDLSWTIFQSAVLVLVGTHSQNKKKHITEPARF